MEQENWLLNLVRLRTERTRDTRLIVAHGLLYCIATRELGRLKCRPAASAYHLNIPPFVSRDKMEIMRGERIQRRRPPVSLGEASGEKKKIQQKQQGARVLARDGWDGGGGVMVVVAVVEQILV